MLDLIVASLIRPETIQFDQMRLAFIQFKPEMVNPLRPPNSEQLDPIRLAPMQPGPIQTDPIQTSPIQIDVPQANPIQLDPNLSDPLRANPLAP